MKIILLCVGLLLQNATYSRNLEDTLSSSWSVVNFQMGKKSCLAIIDRAYRNFSDKASYPYVLIITIKNKKSLPHTGWPTDEEDEIFTTFKQEFINYLTPLSSTIHVGYTTMNKKRQIIMYCKEKDVLTKKIKAFKKINSTKRNFSYSFQEDRDWLATSFFYN